MNIRIEINKEIIERLNKYYIGYEKMGSVLFILIGLYEGKLELLDLIDDRNKRKEIVLLYKTLERLNLIEISLEEEVSLYSLTSEGIELVEFVKKQFSHGTNQSLTTEVLTTVVDFDNVEDWIDEWINLFPEKSAKLGRKFKVHSSEVIDKMNKFIDEYKYNRDTIIGATKAHIEFMRNSEDEYKYLPKCTNFIYRDSIIKESPLATACYEYQNPSEEKPIDLSFFETL